MGILTGGEMIATHGHMRVCTYAYRDDFAHMAPQDILTQLHNPQAISENHNLMCAAGLNQLVAAINWSAVEDQNDNMGSPFLTTYCAPIYGAVGSGSTTPTFGDVELTSEQARGIVTSAGVTPGTSSYNPSVIWLFLLSPPANALTITEAGVFLSALNETNYGLLLDHSTFTGITWSTSQLLTLSVTLSFGN